MKHAFVVFIIFGALLASGCASQQAKTESPRNAPKRSTLATPDKSVTNYPSEETVKPVVVEGEIVGRPAEGSKFAKLKLGMTLKQVEQLIGPPTRRRSFNNHSVSKGKTVRYSYRHEGVLTFNEAEEPVLNRILVNRVER